MKLYDELSSWWPLMSPPAEYTEEAAFYHRILRDASPHPIGTVLELGSGGGNNASSVATDSVATAIFAFYVSCVFVILRLFVVEGRVEQRFSVMQ